MNEKPGSRPGFLRNVWCGSIASLGYVPVTSDLPSTPEMALHSNN